MRIHFIGCKGSSMSVLMKICSDNGHCVSGSDEKLYGHDCKWVKDAQLVVYSAAIPQDNPELVYAKQHNIPALSRGEFLGKLCSYYDTVFTVCGCHGKTTTTAMLYSVLAPFDPTLHIGAKLDVPFCQKIGKDSTSCKSSKKIFISEACEYQRSFLWLKSDYAIFTNIDFDHPDCYENLEQVKNAYSLFYKNCKVVFVNADDKHSKFLLKKPNAISFGTTPNADFCACNVKPNLYGYTFDVFYHKTFLGNFSICVKGMHNVYNALSVIACAFTFGLGRTQILRGLHSFSGVVRRNERVGFYKQIPIVSDYAHHPAEIENQLSTLKSCYKKTLVVFQPHTYSRTNNLLEKFVTSLSKCEYLLICPTFASREKGNDERKLFYAMQKLKNCEFVENDNIILRTQQLAPSFDCVCFMGAGDIDDYARALAKTGN